MAVGADSFESASLAALDSIHALADRLHHSLEEPGVLAHAVQWIVDVSGSPSVAFYALETDNNMLRLTQASEQMGNVLAEGESVPIEGSLSGVALYERELIVSDDIGTDERILPRYREIPSLRGFRTALVLPIDFADEIFGVVYVVYKRHHQVTPIDRRTLRLAGKTIGLALANARHRKDLAQDAAERIQAAESLRLSEAQLAARNESLETIQHITDGLVSTHDYKMVVQKAVAGIVRLSKSRSAAFYTLHPSGDYLELEQAIGPDMEDFPADDRLPIEGSLSGAAITAREVYCSADISSDDRIFPATGRALVAAGFRSAACIPLVTDERILGTVNVLYKDSRDFSDEECDALRAIGRTVALAMTNARQREALAAEVSERRRADEALLRSQAELHERNESLETIHVTTDRLVSTLDYQLVIERAVAGIVRFSKSKSVALFSLSDDGSFLELVHGQGGDVEQLQVGTRIPVDGSLSGIAILERDVVLSPDVASDDRLFENYRTLIPQAGFSSAACIPLVTDDRALGTINILYREARSFSSEEKDTLRAIGRTIALALANARHVEQIESQIEERLRAEELLRTSEERYRLLAENARDVIFRITLPGRRFDYVSPAIEQVFGLSPEQIYASASAAHNLVDKADRGVVDHWWAQLLSGESPEVLEYRIITPKGETRWIHQRNVVVRGDAGFPSHLEGILTDLTDHHVAERNKRRLQEQVQHTQKLESLGVLAGGIAHDFNNLLTGIIGNADLARNEIDEGSPAFSYLTDLRAASERAAELCRQLLAYSGKGRFLVTAIDINEVLREMTHLLSVSISKKTIIKYDLGDNLPAVDVDAAQIRQVVINLITNASEALEERSGFIRIATSVERLDSEFLSDTLLDEELEPGTYLCVEVSDTGTGIDPASITQIFDPFYTTKFTGRGLGLAAVLGIVRGHRGTIKVSSQIGQGTTFKIALPASTETARQVRRPPNQENGWRGEGLVLLVDDEETVRLVGKRMLEQFGFRTMTARDGLEGLDLFRQYADDIVLVVLDLTMPRMDGEEAFLEIRGIRPTVPVILSSGYNEQEVSNRFAGKGLAGFVQKPYRVEALREKVAEALDGRTDVLDGPHSPSSGTN
jgi:PAS domain S-box-containing protein